MPRRDTLSPSPRSRSPRSRSSSPVFVRSPPPAELAQPTLELLPERANSAAAPTADAPLLHIAFAPDATRLALAATDGSVSLLRLPRIAFYLWLIQLGLIHL